MLRGSVMSSASVGLVIGGALIFNYIVASENIPAKMAVFIRRSMSRRSPSC